MSRPDAGAALVITLMLTALLASLGGVLVFLIDTETAISANHRIAQDVRDAAESGIECAMAELGRLPDWSGVTAGTASPSLGCLDESRSERTPDGLPLDLASLTSALQATSDGRYGSPAGNPDSPRWTIFSRGPVRPAAGSSSPYVIVWLADDVDDGDGQAEQDANNVLMVRAEALGILNARASVDALVGRRAGGGTGPAGVRLLVLRFRNAF